MELHFYPGQNLLVVMDKLKVLGRYEAWGGPSALGNDPRMAEEPTWPGSYVIENTQRYTTPSWPMSKIKWGTRLRDMPGQNDVYYELSNGKWASVKNDIKIQRYELIGLYKQYYGLKQAKVPEYWVFNDFGPVAIRWFKDLNGNKILDGKERLSGQMFHTTPENEAQHARGLPVQMVSSHGCIHLKPGDRDIITAYGAFKPKTIFIIHEYSERFTK